MQDLLRRAEAELVALQCVLEQKSADVSVLMLHSSGSVPQPTLPAGPMPVQASEAREREQHWRELVQTAEARLLEEKKLTMAICSDMTRQAKVGIYVSQASGQPSPNPGQPEGKLKSGHASLSVLHCLTVADAGPNRSRPGAYSLGLAMCMQQGTTLLNLLMQTGTA